jgi:hypothetical protein
MVTGGVAMRLRSQLYRAARILGDLSAIRRRRIDRRVANKIIGRNVVRRLWP